MKKIMLAIALLGLFLCYSCKFDTDLIRFNDLIGTWECEEIQSDMFDNYPGKCKVTFSMSTSEKKFVLEKEMDFRTLHPGCKVPLVSFVVEGKWSYDYNSGKVYTTAVIPSSVHYQYIDKRTHERDYTLSHGGENIQYESFEKSDPITLVLDGSVFKKR